MKDDGGFTLDDSVVAGDKIPQLDEPTKPKKKAKKKTKPKKQ